MLWKKFLKIFVFSCFFCFSKGKSYTLHNVVKKIQGYENIQKNTMTPWSIEDFFHDGVFLFVSQYSKLSSILEKIKKNCIYLMEYKSLDQRQRAFQWSGDIFQELSYLLKINYQQKNKNKIFLEIKNIIFKNTIIEEKIKHLKAHGDSDVASYEMGESFEILMKELYFFFNKLSHGFLYHGAQREFIKTLHYYEGLYLKFPIGNKESLELFFSHLLCPEFCEIFFQEFSYFFQYMALLLTQEQSHKSKVLSCLSSLSMKKIPGLRSLLACVEKNHNLIDNLNGFFAFIPQENNAHLLSLSKEDIQLFLENCHIYCQIINIKKEKNSHDVFFNEIFHEIQLWFSHSSDDEGSDSPGED